MNGDWLGLLKLLIEWADEAGLDEYIKEKIIELFAQHNGVPPELIEELRAWALAPTESVIGPRPTDPTAPTPVAPSAGIYEAILTAEQHVAAHASTEPEDECWTNGIVYWIRPGGTRNLVYPGFKFDHLARDFVL